MKAKLSVAIPASVVSDTPHLREKTSKIGIIARAAAIFKVDEIIIYPDDPNANQQGATELIATLLTYAETPQYLRKRLFKLRPELQYAGILPPLRTPHHPLNRRTKELKTGEYREGATVSKASEGTLVDIGVENPAMLQGKYLLLGQRITVKVKKIAERVEVDVADRSAVTEYWGYVISAEKLAFGRLVKARHFDLVVATSKLGVPYANVAREIAEKWRSAGGVLIAFGAPSRGLHEIVERGNVTLDDVSDFVVNMIPRQGTETVRTEEALMASLAILNEHLHLQDSV